MNTCLVRDSGTALVTVFLSAFLFWCYPTSSMAAVEFASPVSYPVGTSPAALAVADLNGDGKPDLAVANSGSGNVSVLLSNGDGTFKPAVNFDAGMAGLTSIEVADFNNDSIQDLAVWSGTSNVSSTLTVLLGNGDGTFQAPKATALPAAVDQATLDLAIADFNLDHKPDLAVLVHDANGGISRIFLMAGKGDGTFQSPQQSSDVLSITVIANVEYLVAGDFNSDAKPDLAVQVPGGVEILLGQGDGTLQAGPITAVAPSGYYVVHLQAGDFNADGKLDVLARSSSDYTYKCGEFQLKTCSGTRSQISLILGNGDGSFQAEHEVVRADHYPSYSHFASLAGDFNGEGTLDVAYVADPAGPQVLLGRGDGAFSPPVPIDSLPNDSSISVDSATLASLILRDLNGDKLGDVIIPDPGSNAVLVVLNASPTSGADLAILGASYEAATGAYTADILNEGPENASGITLEDILPDTVRFISASATQGSCTQSYGVVTCAIGKLATGFDAAVSISVANWPNAPNGTVRNTMKVTAVEPDLAPANNTAAQDAVFTVTIHTAGTGSGTVTANPGGIKCSAECSQHYLSGTSIDLIPTASPGSTFSGWSGDCQNPAPDACSGFGVVSDVSITATFTKTSSGSSDPGGGGGAFTLVDLCVVMFLVLWRARRDRRRCHVTGQWS